MAILALTFAAALLQTQNSLPHDQTGSFLFGGCKVAIQVIDERRTGISTNDMGKADLCAGYISGYTEAKQCAQGGNITDMIRIYVRYMEQHPELLDEGRWIGVDQAIQATYHCHK